jgi:hypothetical protein
LSSWWHDVRLTRASVMRWQKALKIYIYWVQEYLWQTTLIAWREVGAPFVCRQMIRVCPSPPIDHQRQQKRWAYRRSSSSLSDILGSPVNGFNRCRSIHGRDRNCPGNQDGMNLDLWPVFMSWRIWIGCTDCSSECTTAARLAHKCHRCIDHPRC